MEKGIYKIINTINDKIYVGSTFCKGGFKRRWIIHKSGLKKNRHPNKHLQHAWNKYGEAFFIFEIIEVVTDSLILLVREQFYIDLYKTYDDKIGYNILKNAGNNLGYKHTDEAKIKIGLVSKGNKYSLGLKASNETRLKMSKSRQIISVDTRNKLSKSLKGNKNSLGIKPVNIKEVCQISPDGKIIKVWESIAHAAKVLKIKRQNISKVCNGKRITSGGFKWKIVN